MIEIIILVAIIVSVAVYTVVDGSRVKKMTKEKLIEKCKKLIDEGHAERVQSVLMHHPKLLLLHFNELQTRLTEYARAVDEKNKNI